MLTKIISISLVLLFILFSTALSAAVYKCPGKNGKVTFQGRPCVSGKEITIKTTTPATVDNETKKRMQEIKTAADNATIKANQQASEQASMKEARRQQLAALCAQAIKDREHWDTQRRLAHEQRDYDHFNKRMYSAQLRAGDYCSH